MSKFAKGTILGALVGAVAGVLFAPSKGTVTRRKLNKQVNTSKKLLEKQLKMAYTDAVNLSKEVSLLADESTGRAKTAYKNQSEKLDDIISSLQGKVTDMSKKYSEADASDYQVFIDNAKESLKVIHNKLYDKKRKK